MTSARFGLARFGRVRFGVVVPSAPAVTSIEADVAVDWVLDARLETARRLGVALDVDARLVARLEAYA